MQSKSETSSERTMGNLELLKGTAAVSLLIIAILGGARGGARGLADKMLVSAWDVMGI